MVKTRGGSKKPPPDDCPPAGDQRPDDQPPQDPPQDAPPEDCSNPSSESPKVESANASSDDVVEEDTHPEAKSKKPSETLPAANPPDSIARSRGRRNAGAPKHFGSEEDSIEDISASLDNQRKKAALEELSKKQRKKAALKKKRKAEDNVASLKPTSPYKNKPKGKRGKPKKGNQFAHGSNKKSLPNKKRAKTAVGAGGGGGGDDDSDDEVTKDDDSKIPSLGANDSGKDDLAFTSDEDDTVPIIPESVQPWVDSLTRFGLNVTDDCVETLLELSRGLIKNGMTATTLQIQKQVELFTWAPILNQTTVKEACRDAAVNSHLEFKHEPHADRRHGVLCRQHGLRNTHGSRLEVAKLTGFYFVAGMVRLLSHCLLYFSAELCLTEAFSFQSLLASHCKGIMLRVKDKEPDQNGFTWMHRHNEEVARAVTKLMDEHANAPAPDDGSPPTPQRPILGNGSALRNGSALWNGSAHRDARLDELGGASAGLGAGISDDDEGQMPPPRALLVAPQVTAPDPDIPPDLIGYKPAPNHHLKDLFSRKVTEGAWVAQIIDHFNQICDHEHAEYLHPNNFLPVAPPNVHMSDVNRLGLFLVERIMFNQNRYTGDVKTMLKIVCNALCVWYLMGPTATIRKDYQILLQETPIHYKRTFTMEEKIDWSTGRAKFWGVPASMLETAVQKQEFIQAKIEEMCNTQIRVHIRDNGWHKMEREPTRYIHPYTDGVQQNLCGMHIVFVLILKVISQGNGQLHDLEMTIQEFLAARENRAPRGMRVYRGNNNNNNG
jgi:hypothetical protein